MSDQVRVNILERAGKQSAVCEFCGHRSRYVTPLEGQRLSIWDLPGWASAPFPPDFVHGDGSIGSLWTCPRCQRKLRAGKSLYSRTYSDTSHASFLPLDPELAEQVGIGRLVPDEDR